MHKLRQIKLCSIKFHTVVLDIATQVFAYRGSGRRETGTGTGTGTDQPKFAWAC
jgi:hypothetical protein